MLGLGALCHPAQMKTSEHSCLRPATEFSTLSAAQPPVPVGAGPPWPVVRGPIAVVFTARRRSYSVENDTEHDQDDDDAAENGAAAQCTTGRWSRVGRAGLRHWNIVVSVGPLSARRCRRTLRASHLYRNCRRAGQARQSGRNGAKICASSRAHWNDPGSTRRIRSAPTINRTTAAAIAPRMELARHGCLLIAETSCEMRNLFLDRSLLVPSLARGGSARTGISVAVRDHRRPREP